MKPGTSSTNLLHWRPRGCSASSHLEMAASSEADPSQPENCHKISMAKCRSSFASDPYVRTRSSDVRSTPIAQSLTAVSSLPNTASMSSPHTTPNFCSNSFQPVQGSSFIVASLPVAGSLSRLAKVSSAMRPRHRAPPNWALNRTLHGMAPWPCDAACLSCVARPGRHAVPGRLALRYAYV